MKNWIGSVHIGVTVQALLLAAICWYAYGDAGNHGFAFDDEDYIATAALAKEDVSILVDPQLGEPWATRIGVHAYAFLVHDWFGDNPRPYHLANVWVHLLNALLVMFLVRSLHGDRRLAFTAALLFMVSSVHFRALFWISAISVGLGLSFLLIGLLLFVRWNEAGSGTRRGWLLAASVAAFVVAMLFHQALGIGALFPAMLALDRGLSRRRQLQVLAAFGLPGVALLLVEVYAYDGAYSGQPNYILFGWHVLENLVLHVYALFVGGHINVGHVDEPAWVVIVVGIGMVVLVALTTQLLPTRFWATWTLFSALPFLFWAGTEQSSHYFYIPAVGSSVLIAMGLLGTARWMELIWGKVAARSVAGILALALVVVNVLSIDRQQAVQYYDAGNYQLTRENPRGAIHPLKQALRVDEGAPPTVSVLLASAYMQLGRVHEARRVLVRAQSKYPDSKAVAAMIAETRKPQTTKRK